MHLWRCYCCVREDEMGHTHRYVRVKPGLLGCFAMLMTLTANVAVFVFRVKSLA